MPSSTPSAVFLLATFPLVCFPLAFAAVKCSVMSPSDVNEEELYTFFKDCGEVKGVRVVRDKVSMDSGENCLFPLQ